MLPAARPLLRACAGFVLCAVAFVPARADTVIYHPFGAEPSSSPYYLVLFDLARDSTRAAQYGQDMFGTTLASFHKAQDVDAALALVSDLGWPSGGFNDIHIGVTALDPLCANFANLDGSAYDYSNWTATEPNLCATQKAAVMRPDSGQWKTVETTLLAQGALYANPSYDPTPPMTPVPGPPALPMALAGLALLGARRWVTRTGVLKSGCGPACRNQGADPRAEIRARTGD